jgi:hypothetical protein
MKSPGIETDVQSGFAEFIATTQVDFSAEEIGQVPGSSGKGVPGEVHSSLRAGIGKVHHDQESLFALVPGPGGQI